MQIKLITAPEEIIAVAEAIAFMRAETYSAEETMISTMITAARQWAEEYLQRAIGVQTVETVLDKFPTAGRKAIILRPPVISLTSVKYYDTGGVETTLTENTDFFSSLDSEPGEIVPVSTWPIALGKADSIKVRYQTGYNDPGDSPSPHPLPRTIRTAMLMQIADLYDNRGAQSDRPLSANPTLERMLSMYRLEMGI